MKAVDYFREYGLVESKRHLEWMVRVEARQGIHGWFMDDLKRYVDSYELVESYGGLEQYKNLLVYCSPPLQVEYSDLKQAIVDVESCK